MPMRELKQREEVLQVLLKRIDSEIETFSMQLGKFKAKQNELSNVVMDARLEPVPITFQPNEKIDINVIRELEDHILELNKVKNLLGMKLKRILQEEDLLEHLQSKFGKNVSFKRTEKGLIELQVKDKDADEAFDLLQDSKKRLDQLRGQIHELGDAE